MRTESSNQRYVYDCYEDTHELMTSRVHFLALRSGVVNLFRLHWNSIAFILKQSYIVTLKGRELHNVSSNTFIS
jgi:hypothetical protein